MNGWRVLDIEEELLMRRIIALCIAAVLVFCVAACGSQKEENEITQSSGTKTSAAESQGLGTENSAAVKRTLPEPEYGDMRIQFAWDDKEMIVRLIDNEAAKNLLSRLPLSLNFEDYRGRQKTGVVPAGLDTGNVPEECDCFAGDMNYYAPWDMLTFFYKDFGYAPDLTPLGVIESSLEYLEEIDEGSTVTIDLIR